MMDYKKLRLELGLPAPVRVLHITDPHLVAADGRDNPRKWALAAKRAEQMAGATAEAYLQEALDYGEKHCDVTVCTGDLMDFITEAACDKLRALCRRPRLLFAVGNHEFSQYVGERTEDLAYKMETFTQVQSCVPQNLDFASTVVGGVNFITLDNSYYQFSGCCCSRSVPARTPSCCACMCRSPSRSFSARRWRSMTRSMWPTCAAVRRRPWPATRRTAWRSSGRMRKRRSFFPTCIPSRRCA